MTEYDLIFAWSEVTGHLWSMIQFWASVSFGLIAIAHLAATKLNTVLVTVALVLYASLSMFIGSLIYADGQILLAVYTDAARYAASVENVSETIRSLAAYQASESFGGVFFILALPGTFLATVSYFIYAFIVANRGD